MLGLAGFSASKQFLTRDCPASNQVLQLIEDDPEDLINREERTPLILVHGVFGTQDLNDLNDNYWKSFLTYFKSTLTLSQKFKIYRFHYLSNKCPASDLAKGFGQQIDQMIRRGKLEDKPVVILAHSMGGLIARAYMNNYHHRNIGNYEGQPGGERVLKLITLATPHHGTPAANKEARDALARQNNSVVLYGWLDALQFSDIAYWCSDRLSSCENALVPNLPNRGALRYDNFDRILPSLEYETRAERNDWLIKLNGEDSQNPNKSQLIARRYDKKVIAYYGYINPDDPYRSYLSDWYEGAGRISSILKPIANFPYETVFNYHLGLIASSVVMDIGLSHAFPLNDGMVPVLSGSFYGHDVGGRRVFVGYDHLDMKDGKVDKSGRVPLFESLTNDLLDLTNQVVITLRIEDQRSKLALGVVEGIEDGDLSGQIASRSSILSTLSKASFDPQSTSLPALTPITFDGTASKVDSSANLNQDSSQNILSYFWDFGDGFTQTGEIVEHTYLTPGKYKVALTIQTSSGDKNTTSVTVSIHNPQIDVVPLLAWSRKFSGPESSFITSYHWDFGDGTTSMHSSQMEHTYDKGGYYKVTLTLTTSTGTTLRSITHVVIGTGPTVVPGGTLVSNEIWLAEGSPYLIQESITVAEGAVLTLEPGTIVQFNPGASLIVNGTLKALGTQDQKIIFTSYRDNENRELKIKDRRSQLSSSVLDSPAPGDWGQIYFSDTSLNSLLDHVIVRYGRHNIQISGSSPTITHSSMTYGANGIRLSGASKATFSENFISGSRIGMSVLGSSPDLTRNIFENNYLAGLTVDNESSPKIIGNLFINNEVAIDIAYDRETNVIFLNNVGSTIKDVARVRGIISSYALWNNTITYIIDKTGLTIAPEGVLTLAPGTLVKGYAESFFNVFGILLADGTESQRVVFTSIKDDAVGGDTNRDGNKSHPEPGDWKGINFQDRDRWRSVLRYYEILYAGTKNQEVKSPGDENGKKSFHTYGYPPQHKVASVHQSAKDLTDPINIVVPQTPILDIMTEIETQSGESSESESIKPIPLPSLLTPNVQSSTLDSSTSPITDPNDRSPGPVSVVSVPTPIEGTSQVSSDNQTVVSASEPSLPINPVINLISSKPDVVSSRSTSTITPPCVEGTNCSTTHIPNQIVSPTVIASSTAIPIPPTPTPVTEAVTEALTFCEGTTPCTPEPPSDCIAEESCTPVMLSWGMPEDIPVPSDYDGDQKADPAVWRPDEGTWYLLLSSSNEGSSAPKASIEMWGIFGDKPIPADYDGDGQSDLAVWRPSNQRWLIRNSSGGLLIRQLGKFLDLPLPADYDGDGIIDMAAWQTNSTTQEIRETTIRNVEKSITYKWSLPEDVPLPGDYDGDGKADVAVWRPTVGLWYIPLSSSQKPLIQPWGFPGDKPIPKDYDGDAQTDLALWRPSEGVWYILLSTGGILKYSLGKEGDIPVPADYDGDRKVDIAVWQPETGTWYILFSSRR